MKTKYCFVRRLVILIFFIWKISWLSAQDIPGASANIQTAPAGTLVIAMDHANQASSTINAASGTYLFNLKAYGLVTLLRNAGIYVKWVINTGKAKDGIDFTGTAERIYPNYVAPQSLDFRAGPFLVFPSDTLGADYLIQWFNYSLPDSCKVKVHRLTTDVDVDVRYTLTNPPRIAILHDSCDIHRNFMETASVPTVNYDCLQNASGLIAGCYTMITAPHMVPGDLSAYDSDSIYNFLQAGGNFLAECESVQTFESLRAYHSSSGTIVDPTGGQFNNFNNNVNYDNPAMAYAQFQGTFRPWLRGAQKVWRYNSSNINNFYPVVSCRRNGTDNLYYVAAVSKLTTGLGSLVFYLGNHEYKNNDCHTCLSSDLINEQEINGMRLYLNAIQIPTEIIPCVVLDVTLRDFTATKQNDQTVLLKWNTLSETGNSFFVIEHSLDARNYIPVGKKFSNGNTTQGYHYNFTHANPVNGVNYYRLKIVDVNGKAEYSSSRIVVFGKNVQKLTIFPNPAKNKTTVLLDENDGEKLFVKLLDGAGRMVKQQTVTIKNQQAELNIEGLHTGMYVVIAVAENGQRFSNKIMINQ
jgi:hypothetical protein